MGTKCAELELGLRWRHDDDRFDVSIHYDDPDSANDVRELGAEPLSIDADALAFLHGDPTAYGRQLTDQVLRSESDVLKMYRQARAIADNGELPVHVRLLLDPKAPAWYHALRWELLGDPDDDSPIATRNNISFSRYLSTSDWRTISPPRKHELRALAVIANPDLGAVTPGGRSLAALDLPQEENRARQALAGMQVTLLAGEEKRATLPAVREALSADAHGDRFDVLYVVCHGAYLANESVLYLEKPDGTYDGVTGSQISEMIAGLQHRPTIAVICACRSVGGGDEASDEVALKSLGPRLAEAGIPAVLAMQGDFTVESAARFIPSFFEALGRDGVVDRAVAHARGQIADRRDWWMPVLFSRLRTGRTYYLPEFSERSQATWTALIDGIQTGMCTPVIGPGVADRILGSRSGIAQRWVERWQAPISRHNRTDLSKVAQYLTVRVAQRHPEIELRKYVMAELRERYAKTLPSELLQGQDPEPAVLEVGRLQRAQDEHDPFRIIAELPAPIFVTTNWTGLLAAALTEAGKQPVVRSFDWTAQTVDAAQALEEEPRVERPLVYHMFGRLEHPDTLVLSEDDYFAWIKSWIERRNETPIIGTALTRRSLLFLGYELDDWDFRVLFQGVQSFGGRDQLKKRQHVGVQLRPDSQLMESDAAQEYLESYLDLATVRIFWGETSEFLRKLQARLKDEE
ncbi:CHAT domain-containing protein [Nocardia amikacinitolerans]|uniref:CHAT domain-containing protein n=1 Tax=Nocardia amikacinitolerans TaxID=756689 RepID=A0A285L1B6_9NOCA|nr:CHAT domain-containing protein [Nocardia amikacinitolerans]SNY78694.1 CHAT domain-containing protein [Nocardia amikacinitolerans]